MGEGTAITPPGRTSIEPNLSRDGTKVAYHVPYGETGGSGQADVRNELWVESLVDGSEAPVIADGKYSRWFGRWSPDGTQLVYGRRDLRTNERQLMVWSSQTHDEQPLAAPNTFTNIAARTDGRCSPTANSQIRHSTPGRRWPHRQTARENCGIRSVSPGNLPETANLRKSERRHV